MTCIAGLQHGGKVYLGGDSAGVAEWSLRVRADEKVFATGEFVMGFTTSFRMGNLLRFRLNVPEQTSRQSDYEFMCTSFIDAARDCMKDGGYAKVSNGVETGGDFLVGYRGTLYYVGEDFQVGTTALGFDAVGSGHELAVGALAASAIATPEARIEQALQIAEQFNAGVRGPFTVVSA